VKDSRRRLVVLAGVYFCAVVVLLVHLGRTMVVDHDDWLRRSYTNRWAFRDVPTKRGAVRDRRGELLVFDAPTSALELHYREFRRRHPCGAALHCANLIRQSRRSTELSFTPAGVRSAFKICIDLPLDVLRGLQGDLARDVRFYLTSLFAGLTDESRYRVGAEIRRALAGGARGSVAEYLGLQADRLLAVFRGRLTELEDIARLVQPRRNFWADLQACEARRRINPRTEHVVRRLHDEMVYEDALRIARRGYRHPGIRVRPSVSRERGAADVRWDTLAPHLGAATAQWAGDADKLRRAEMLETMAPQLETMSAADEDLPEFLRPSVTARLRGAMATHLMSQGRVGRSGIELDQDAVLRGSAGMHWVSRGRRRRDIGLWSTFDVTPGDDVYLTVDLALQNLLEHAVDEALAGRPEDQLAAIAIIDPKTGDVLAVASRPTRSVRLKMKTGVPDPVITWAGTGFIGSLAKPLILAEHLDAKRRGRPFADPMDFDFCRGEDPMRPNPDVPYRRHRLRCDHDHAGLVRDRVESLSKSCNYFFYQVGEGLGWDGVRRAYDRFGLFREKGARLPGRGGQRGPAPPPSKWFQAHVPGIPAASYPNPTWQEHSNDIQRRAIGYFVEANVLQMVRAYAGLATGRLPELSLVRRRPEDLRSLDLGLHPDDLAVIHEGMERCCHTGTARDLGLTGVWAKTGTAEISKTRLAGGRYRTKNNAWLAGFVGLAPSKLAFACVVYGTEQGGFGAKVAGPMFEIFLRELRANPQLAKAYL
jgi:cell division protein FtsI/penicillin-binding protein 2